MFLLQDCVSTSLVTKDYLISNAAGVADFLKRGFMSYAEANGRVRSSKVMSPEIFKEAFNIDDLPKLQYLFRYDIFSDEIFNLNKELLSDRIVDFKEGGIYLDTDGETKWVYLGHTGLYYGVDTEFVLTNGDMFIKYHELNNLRSKLVNALNSPDRKILVKDLFCYTDIPYLVREIGAIHVDNLDLFESFDHFTSDDGKLIQFRLLRAKEN